MQKIDQYLIYVDFYTEISKITTLCIPSSQRSPTLYQPPEHLYRSRIGRASTVSSCAVILVSLAILWQFLQIHDDTADDSRHPLVPCG
jgi:hypothetical protein